ncbi:MAG: hypothetical protein ACRD0J_07285, partial [Acidimicrobiales bacterium]
MTEPGSEREPTGPPRKEVVLTGRDLTPAEVAEMARERAVARVDEGAMGANRAAWELARELVGRQPIYGRTTGVGANRDQPVAWEPPAGPVAPSRSGPPPTGPGHPGAGPD